MALYFALAADDDRFFGTPRPAPGVRVSFVPERLFAARRRGGLPVDRRLKGDEGLVVHEDPADILVWPDSLWRVEDIEGPVRPFTPGAPWFRCQAFTVVEQVPTWLVAGPHGHAVEWVVAKARTLTPEQVRALAALPEDHEKALAKAPRAMRTGSHGFPLGCGGATVYDAVAEAARAADPALYVWDEAADGWVFTDPAWESAGRAASAAALALGTPERFPAEQAEALARRWTTVFGTPPPSRALGRNP